MSETSPKKDCAIDSLDDAASAKPKIKYDWYQTDSQVVVTILLRNAEKDKVKMDCQARSLSVSCPIPNSPSEYTLELDLAYEVVPSAVQLAVTPFKIEIKLKKSSGGQWAQLEGNVKDNCIATPIPQAIIDASGPQAIKCPFRKDWNKIEQEIKKEEESEKPEGEEALNQLFQKIYGGGSDEVRKAMNKSYMESGGTVLSTNWKEVAQDKVGVKPPDGLEWKKWDS